MFQVEVFLPSSGSLGTTKTVRDSITVSELIDSIDSSIGQRLGNYEVTVQDDTDDAPSYVSGDHVITSSSILIVSSSKGKGGF